MECFFKQARGFQILIILIISIFDVGCENHIGDGERPDYLLTYSELYSVNKDGSILTQLTSGKNFIHYADFISNSSKIFFVQTGTAFDGSFLSYKKQVVCTMDLTNGLIDTVVFANIYQNAFYVYETTFDYPRSIDVSHDGLKIFYAGRLPDMHSERKDIFSVDLQTKQVTNLTNTPIDGAVGNFRLSFDNGKIIYTEFEIGKKRTQLKLMDANGGNKLLLLESDTVDFLYPQLLANNRDIVYLERNQSDFSKTRLVIFNIESAKQATIEQIRPSIHFFPEINKDNIIVIDDFADSISSPISFNLNTNKRNHLGMNLYAQPFLSASGAELIYFESPWKLNSVNIDGSQPSMILNHNYGIGTTHVPQLSISNKIILINKNTMRLRQGDVK